MSAPAIFPRRHDRHCSSYQRNRERRTRIKTHQLRARASAGADPVSVRLDDDQRLAQIAHARRHGFARWELAELVPGPVTPAELAAAGVRA